MSETKLNKKQPVNKLTSLRLFQRECENFESLNFILDEFDYNRHKRLRCFLCTKELTFIMYMKTFFCTCANEIDGLIYENRIR